MGDSIDHDVLIIDECHVLRNPNTKFTRYVSKKATKMKYRIGLSATPIMNNLNECYSLFQNFIQPFNMSKEMFENTLAKIVKKGSRIHSSQGDVHRAKQALQRVEYIFKHRFNTSKGECSQNIPQGETHSFI